MRPGIGHKAPSRRVANAPSSSGRGEDVKAKANGRRPRRQKKKESLYMVSMLPMLSFGVLCFFFVSFPFG